MTKWSREHIWVLDLELGSGAIFKMGCLAKVDLAKVPARF